MGMNILRTATRHSDAVLHEHGMHFHLPTAPRMPRIPDFSDFNNMGVVLITCTMRNGITRAKTTCCYSPPRLHSVLEERRSFASNVWADCSGITRGPHNFLTERDPHPPFHTEQHSTCRQYFW